MKDNRCKRREKRREACDAPYLIVAVALAAAVFWDLRRDLPRLLVDESYLGQIFAALCTVAALGTAMQSVIVGAFQHKILGFTVRELLQYLPGRFNLKRTVCAAFFAILLAMVFLAAEFYTAMTVLTVCVVFLIGQSSLSIWHLLADLDEEVLTKRLQATSGMPPETYYAKWFPEVRQALADGDEQKLDKYLDHIRMVAQASQRESASILQAQAGSIFPSACERLGFVDAYKKILLLNDWDFRGLDDRAAANDYIDQIRFCPDSALFTYRIASTVDDIFERLKLDDREKIEYAYRYYSAIEKNTVIACAVRRDMIRAIFEKLCLLYDKGTGAQRAEALLYVVRNILGKEDVPDREMQWGLLVGELYQHHYNRDVCYIGVIAQMFRALFFYSFFERETLREEYRNGLKGLCTFSCTGKDVASPSLSMLVLQMRFELVKWFAADLKRMTREINRFDYFPKSGDGKTLVWDVRTCTCFAFWFYLLVGCQGEPFPYELSPRSEDARKRDGEVCEALLSNFEGEGDLTSNAKEMIQKMRDFLGARYSLAEALAGGNFSHFNRALADLRRAETEAKRANISEDTGELNAAFARQLEEMDGARYSPDLSLDGAREIIIEPSISRSALYNVENRASHLSDMVQQALNEDIGRKLRSEKLWFGKKSVHRLYELLSSDAYKYTNCLYTNDLGFHREMRESDEFKGLKALLEELEVFSDRNIRQSVFLRRPIRFNARVVEYALREPADAQCEEFIENYRIADGKYRIDDVLYDHAQAIERARMFKAEYCTIAVATDVDEDSGFRVELDRSAEKAEDSDGGAS